MRFQLTPLAQSHARSSVSREHHLYPENVVFEWPPVIGPDSIRDPHQGPPPSAPEPLKRPLPLRDGTPLVVPLAELVCAPPEQRQRLGHSLVRSCWRIRRFGTPQERRSTRTRSILLPVQLPFA